MYEVFFLFHNRNELEGETGVIVSVISSGIAPVGKGTYFE